MFSAEYSYALELEASKEDGIREGRVIGREEGVLSVARSLVDIGLSFDKIAQATGPE